MTLESSFSPRLEKVRTLLETRGLQGILFTSLENIRYLCGFTGSDGALVVTREEACFLTDSRYWTQSEEEVRGARVVHYKKKMDGIAVFLQDLGPREIGFEASALSFSAYLVLSEKLGDGVNLVPLEEEIRGLRQVKDAAEIAILRKAIEISSKAFNHILGLTREGALERELAFEMECAMKRHGAEAVAFDTIIASGRRSALPHGKAGEKRIERGDMILVDFGCRYEGYHSDETCTVAVGEPGPEMRKIFQIVRDAHDRAIELIRPGVPIRDVDAAARDYIRDQGYGDFFGHGTGHGVGLAVHEEPPVNSLAEGLVQEGMVFTVEPGIYLPDRGGVRLEDMIYVTATGAEHLTYLSKDLVVL
jgi:Xaa-Pro aminopeptidase